MKSSLPLVSLLLASATVIVMSIPCCASAELLCVKQRITARSTISLGSALVVTKEARCPRGFKALLSNASSPGTGVSGPQGPQGPQGPAGQAGAQGPAGVDGSLRVYGDGSQGSRTIAVSELMTEPLVQFVNLTISSGATLTVPTGTVIRCSGAFRNNGSIQILPEALGGVMDASSTTTLTVPSHASPGAALVASVAASGEYGVSAVRLYGGRGGSSFSDPVLRTLVRLSVFGGGAGGAGRDSTGGAGGGTLTVIAGGEIVNNGVLSANGANGIPGAGGGGGGAVVLASKVSIANTGVIQVNGGAGGNSKLNSAAGGGGGGGLVHLIAPAVSVSPGSIQAKGGQAGTTTVAVNASPRAAGGGGGAGVGAGGGFGCSVSSAASGSLQSDCHDGEGAENMPLVTIADPTSFF
jgi:hypothetical protein